jgi:uncharacterized protein (DUF2147 family)
MNPLQRLCCIFLSLIAIHAWAGETDVAGRWLSGDGEGWIEIQIVDGSLIGVIAGSRTAQAGDPPRYDDLNPDPQLRDRPLDGMTIMSGLTYEGDSHWSGGTIYDPNSGKTYKCTLTQVDANTVKLRGYIGISLFGRSDTWTRDE